jgi:hypothetical protein
VRAPRGESRDLLRPHGLAKHGLCAARTQVGRCATKQLLAEPAPARRRRDHQICQQAAAAPRIQLERDPAGDRARRDREPHRQLIRQLAAQRASPDMERLLLGRERVQVDAGVKLLEPWIVCVDVDDH